MKEELKTQDLIFGKWYTSSEWRSNSFAQFKGADNGSFNYTKAIIGTHYKCENSSWETCSKYREATEEELIKWVPDYVRKFADNYQIF